MQPSSQAVAKSHEPKESQVAQAPPMPSTSQSAHAQPDRPTSSASGAAAPTNLSTLVKEPAISASLQKATDNQKLKSESVPMSTAAASGAKQLAEPVTEKMVVDEERKQSQEARPSSSSYLEYVKPANEPMSPASIRKSLS